MEKYSFNEVKRIRIALLFLVAVLTLVASWLYISFSQNLDDSVTTIGDYNGHYAFVVSDTSDDFLDGVFERVSQRTLEDGIFVEKVGENLSGTYTIAQKLEMAMASNPDGIIVQADDTAEVRNLIRSAVADGIPVVTIMTDSPGSERQSFVGPNPYDLGKAYGERIRNIEHEGIFDIAVLMDSNLSANSQNSIYQGIVAGVYNSGRRYNIDIIALDRSNDIQVEENVRTLILDDTQNYDAIIALDMETTQFAYQAMVDYNKIADMDIIGFYISDSILNGIKVGNLNSSITLDPSEIADNCVKALYEYSDYGYSNYYIPVSIQTITKDNVDEFWGEISQDNIE